MYGVQVQPRVRPVAYELPYTTLGASPYYLAEQFSRFTYRRPSRPRSILEIMQTVCPSRSSLTLAILVGVSCLLSTATASTITVTGIGYGRSDVSMLLNGSTAPTSEYAIEILISKGGTNFIAYCVDLFTPISFGTYNTTTGLPNSYANGGRAAWVYENYSGLVTNNDQGSSLQVALWDIVHDGGDGLAAGNIQLSPTEFALSTYANAIVQASVGRSSQNATILYNTVISNGAPAQNLITGAAAYDGAVLEPGSLALVVIGTASLWLVRRRT